MRELENLIERSVILSQGPELRVPHADISASADISAEPLRHRLVSPVNTNSAQA
jgi:hypothetical protein